MLQAVADAAFCVCVLHLCAADVHLSGLEEAPQQLQIRAPHAHHPRVSSTLHSNELLEQQLGNALTLVHWLWCVQQLAACLAGCQAVSAMRSPFSVYLVVAPLDHACGYN